MNESKRRYKFQPLNFLATHRAVAMLAAIATTSMPLGATLGCKGDPGAQERQASGTANRAASPELSPRERAQDVLWKAEVRVTDLAYELGRADRKVIALQPLFRAYGEASPTGNSRPNVVAHTLQLEHLAEQVAAAGKGLPQVQLDGMVWDFNHKMAAKMAKITDRLEELSRPATDAELLVQADNLFDAYHDRTVMLSLAQGTVDWANKTCKEPFAELLDAIRPAVSVQLRRHPDWRRNRESWHAAFLSDLLSHVGTSARGHKVKCIKAIEWVTDNPTPPVGMR